MEYKVVKRSGLYYYKGEDGKLYGEGYKGARNFAPNGFAVVVKGCSKWYYINEKFETVSEGYSWGGDFASNGLAIVEKADGLKYYINEKFETLSEGYVDAYKFASNGLAVVKKADGLKYYINEEFETVSDGYRHAYSFGSDGLARVIIGGRKQFINEDFELVDLGKPRKERAETGKRNTFLSRENRELLYRYLKGELKVSELPDECFVGRSLAIIKETEKKKYEHSMEIAQGDEMLMQRVQAYYDFNSQFIKDKIKEVRYKNQEYSPDEM